ncbi:MAG TPA: Lrp/AsnC family transcriptional regulator [Candidatus Deferrimicrobiaceae bacterium]|nr:Lrp/AsnC family transcriptional regulator [Candidatus Deferrimicrobiaceae bacterium]
MDKIDLFIIEALTKNARTSFRQIAAALNVSPDTIIDRYSGLQEKGVIRGSTIVLNPKEIGYNAMAVFMIDLSPNNENSKKPFDSTLIVETLIKMRNIIVASKTVGDHDLMAIGVIKDFNHLVEVRNEIAAVEGVKDMEVSFWTEITELSPKYFVI